ncbi:MAG: hypothetical protein IAE91_08645 [Ignavibacteriaceae bacterium]|nr:hypothetical protein [Ignavibacteriaceae bacterium]
MGNQQLLLIVLSMIIVAIAVAVGISLFQTHSAQFTIDTMIEEMRTIATEGQEYNRKPGRSGGGGGAFTGFSPGVNRTSTETADYQIVFIKRGAEMRITGTSKAKLAGNNQPLKVRTDVTATSTQITILNR